MHGQNGDPNLAVENNVAFQIVQGLGVGADAHGVLERLEIGVESEPSLPVEGGHFVVIDRTSEHSVIIDVGVPGPVALRSRFQFSAKREDKRNINQLSPKKLVGFL